MRTEIIARVAVLTSILATSMAQAAVPFMNATCPGGIEVHADEGGPIYINGEEARLKRFSDSAYEARADRVTITLTIRPDGSPEVSYAGRGGANGVCQVAASPDDGTGPG